MSGDELLVRFTRPIPIFPLSAVSLLPHGVLPLHVFEPRYRQLISDALDGSGQIAMGVFEGDQWRQEYHGRPALRPAVCLGQIIEHHKLPDGRYNVALQGLCRARIVEESPASEARLYREAMLEPLGELQPDEHPLDDFRYRLVERLNEAPLTDLRDAGALLEHLSDPDIPTSTLMELLTLSLVDDAEVRYRLLAEPSALRRAEVVGEEMEKLSRLLRMAVPQRRAGIDMPKGCNPN